MWHIRQDFCSTPDKHRRDKQWSKRRGGFSHPAGFERLEERLSLDASGGTSSFGDSSGNGILAGAGASTGNTSQFGSPTPGGQFGGQLTQAGTPLPGTGNPTSSPNPGVIGGALASSLVPPDDAVAFNNPSWVPQDRPPFPITSPPNDALPANVNQTASTPFGIRNFMIGANTSVAHGNSSRFGLGSATARSPERGTRMTELLGDSFEEGLLAAKASNAMVSMLPAAEQATESSSDDHGRLASQPDREKLDVSSVVRLAAFADDGPLQSPEADLTFLSEESRTSKNGTMAEHGQEEFNTAGLAIAEVASERSDAEGESTSSDVQALAASFAVAAMVRRIPQ